MDCAYYNKGECVQSYTNHIKIQLKLLYNHFDRLFSFAEEDIKYLIKKVKLNEKPKNVFEKIMVTTSIYHDSGKLSDLYLHRKGSLHHNYLSSLFFTYQSITNEALQNVLSLNTHIVNLHNVVNSLIYHHHEAMTTHQENLNQSICNTQTSWRQKFEPYKNYKVYTKTLSKLTKQYLGYKLDKDKVLINEMLNILNYKGVNKVLPYNINSKKILLISKLLTVFTLLDNLSALPREYERPNPDHCFKYKGKTDYCDLIKENKFFREIYNDFMKNWEVYVDG